MTHIVWDECGTLWLGTPASAAFLLQSLKLMVSDGSILIPGNRLEGQRRMVSLKEGFRKFLDAAHDASVYILLARMYRHTSAITWVLFQPTAIKQILQ